MHLSRTAAAAAFAMAMAAVSPHVAHAAIDVNPDEFAIALFNGGNFRSRDLFVLDNDTGKPPLRVTRITKGPNVGTCAPTSSNGADDATAITWLRDDKFLDFSGNITCTYEACDDDGDCGEADVLLKIQPVTAWNDPEAVSGKPIKVEPNKVTRSYNVVDNDSKPDGIQLRVIDVHVVSGPGSCSISSTDARRVVFRRATLDFRATTTVCSYQACTTTVPVYCDSAEVTFTAKALEDIPPFLDATNDRYILPDNQPSSPEGDIKVLLNDGSNRPIRLSPQIVTGPAAGAGTCTVVDDRTRIRYTRPARSLFEGEAVCVYQVCTVPRIGEAQLCQTAILTVVVRQPGSRVIAVNDEFAVNAEVVESRVLPVLANDGTNPPGRKLIVAAIDTQPQPDFGRCIISGDRFGIRFRPGAPINGFPAFVQCSYTACTTDTLTPVVCDDATVTINLLIGQTSFPTSTPTRKPTRKPVTKSPGTCCIPKCTFHYDPLKFSIRT